MTAAVQDARRADAQRNHERIVAAARKLFATDGVDASVRQVAGCAGLGVGTVYRHFPTRDDLIDAVLEDAFEENIAIAERALEHGDPWAGFCEFLEQTLALHVCNRALRDVVETHARGRERAAAMRRRIAPLVRELVERAQADGSLRHDFTPQDVALIYWATDRVIEMSREVAPEAWRRQLGFVLDGLRASAATPLSAPPLRQAQLARVGLQVESG